MGLLPRGPGRPTVATSTWPCGGPLRFAPFSSFPAFPQRFHFLGVLGPTQAEAAAEGDSAVEVRNAPQGQRGVFVRPQGCKLNKRSGYMVEGHGGAGCAGCKVLTLHGLLTRHVAHARARYRCRTAVHTASTLEVQYRTLSELSLGYLQT